MSSENMSFEKSIYSDVKCIKGPFRADPNISLALFAFSGDLWIFNRPAVGEPNEDTKYGVMEFKDVRIHRIRAYTHGCLIESDELDSSVGWWAVEIDDSEYLRESIKKDQQRTPMALATHHHYVVYDGWDRVIEIIARSLVSSTINFSSIINLKKLFDREENPIEDI